MAYLMKNTSDDKKGKTLLFAEARVLLAAGGSVFNMFQTSQPSNIFSDTTAIALTEVLILLAYYPAYVKAIRLELDPLFAESNFCCQTAYPVLESVINETLRLYPPALFGSPRVTPSEGLQIDTVFIPGDTVVYMPQYQLHHDPRNFVRPEEFLPERWTVKSDMILNRSAYIPFSMGKSFPSYQLTETSC
jgi:cytochrome P450